MIGEELPAKKSDDHFNLYLHVFNYPINKKLGLTGISDIPEKIYMLSDKQKSPLQFSYSGSFTEIKLPELQHNPYISVIVVRYKKKPTITEGLVAKGIEGGYSLTPRNIIQNNETLNILKEEREGTVPESVVIDSNKTLKWKLYVDSPGEKDIDISYSYQNSNGKNKLILRASNTALEHIIQSTGKTVGEPNQNWVIDNFKSKWLGKINFPDKGFYEIEMEVLPEKKEEIKFQWIWVN